MAHFDTSHWDGKCLEQCDAQLGATGDISEAVVLIEKFEQSQQMWISLNLIEKNQSVFLAAQLFSRQSA